MKTIRLLFGISCLSLVLFATSCNKDSGKSRLTVYLTDAPAEYDAVNIDIAALEIKTTNDTGDDGWQTLSLVSPGVNNLLEFTNGMDALLASIELPAGKVSQLRLILGDDNTVVVNGVSQPLPLETPSAQTSGLKFNIHADLVEGVEYKIWIDFDAARSIVVTGNNSYILKPVIRTFTEATSGAIKGVVLPAASDPWVSAIMGTDTLSAAPDPVTGQYLIRGVPPGIWKILADGSNGYIDQTINNINVTLGQLTVVDTITLVQ